MQRTLTRGVGHEGANSGRVRLWIGAARTDGEIPQSFDLRDASNDRPVVLHSPLLATVGDRESEGALVDVSSIHEDAQVGRIGGLGDATPEVDSIVGDVCI